MMEIWCEEVDKSTGEVAFYKVCEEPTPEQISHFSLRSRFNPELQYWATNLAGKVDEKTVKKLFKNLRKPPYFVRL